MPKLLSIFNRKVIFAIIITISLIMIGIGIILASSLFSVDNVLVTAYKKTEISESLNRYKLYFSLTGQTSDKIYHDVVSIENYKGTNYRVTIIKFDIGEDGKEIVSEEIMYYVIDGIAYSRDDKNKYHEIKEEIIYDNTDIYLKGLLNAKEIVYVGKEEMEDNEYEKYTFIIDTKIMSEILKYSNLPDLVFDKKTIKCSALLDSDGFVFRLSYYIDTGLDESTSLMLELFVVEHNEGANFPSD
jgi:hypothetical protein